LKNLIKSLAFISLMIVAFAPCNTLDKDSC
jgi:hypothetical protein